MKKMSQMVAPIERSTTRGIYAIGSLSFLILKRIEANRGFMESKRKAKPHHIVTARIKEVKEWLLLGYTRSEVLQLSSKFKVSDRMVDEYIKQARDQIREVNQLETKDMLDELVASQRVLYRAAIATKDLKLARQILMDIAKLRGLDQTTVNVNVQRDEDLMKMSDDDLDKILGQEQRH